MEMSENSSLSSNPLYKHNLAGTTKPTAPSPQVDQTTEKTEGTASQTTSQTIKPADTEPAADESNA